MPDTSRQEENKPNGKIPIFCSWSGGKDSALALYRAIQMGYRPARLITMMTEGGVRSRSHGLHLSVLQAQADSMGIPLITYATTWDDYTTNYRRALEEARLAGISTGVFGDIDHLKHRSWVVETCASEKVTPILPLWNSDRSSLLQDLVKNGFCATVIAVRKGDLDPALLGRVIDQKLIAELKEAEIDLCGEKGEYHTVVSAGALFAKPLSLSHGHIEFRDGVYFLDVQLKAIIVEV